MDSKELLEAEDPEIHSELVDISLVSIDMENAPRKEMGDLSSLEASIRKLGIITPVLLDTNNALISGKRRIQACRNLGIERIPAIRYSIEARSLTGLAMQSDDNMCRIPWAEDEMNEFIQTKETVLAEQDHAQGPGIVAYVKKLISGMRGGR